MQAFVDRFRYKASKARQAQSRLKALAKMEPIAEVIEAPDVVLRFPKPQVPPPPLITLDGRRRRAMAEQIVLDRLDLRIDPDDRIALLGANGNGKSTFAKLLAGRLAPHGGRDRARAEASRSATSPSTRSRSCSRRGARSSTWPRSCPTSGRSACAPASAASASARRRPSCRRVGSRAARRRA